MDQPSASQAGAAASLPSQSFPARATAENPPRRLSDQLSHPVLSTPYPLPPPPKGFKFRPILKPGHEVAVSLSLISGRYYPGLLFHPLMASTVAAAVIKIHDQSPDEAVEPKHIFAMEGLMPGVHQSMDPRFWRGSRVLAMQEADQQARTQFKGLWEDAKMARLHPDGEAGEQGADAMEVD